MATDDKYDRQLRLWGANGQKALSETTVVLLRATAVGTETLKNLVLPGVGHILVVDDVEFSSSKDNKEYSSNFFLTQEEFAAAKPKSRAEMALLYLQELNPDVQGAFEQHASLTDKTVDDWKTMFQKIISSSGNNILVIGSDLEPKLKSTVSQACETSQIPIIQVTSYGMMGMVRIQTPPLPLLDPKPSSSVPDLRLAKPFGELQQYTDSVDLSKLDDKDHGHVPYPILLLQLVKKFDKPIQSMAEKEEFKAFVKQHSRDYNKELNFQEAIQNAYLAYTAKEFDKDQLENLLAKLKQRQESNQLTKSTWKLYILLQALAKFLQDHDSQPPLHGTIPDMTSSTDLYVQLQKLYKEKAQEDRKQMKTIIDQVIQATDSNGDSSSIPTISEDDLETFCKNVHTIDLLDTGSLEQEYTNYSSSSSASASSDDCDMVGLSTKIPEDIMDDLNMATYDPYDVPVHTPILWYFGLRACFMYYDQYQRYPGMDDASLEKDTEEVHDSITKLVALWNLQENEFVSEHLLQNKDIATELTRYGNAQIHNIASYIGGIASQEAVKIITGQYVPINNTFVYNGIASVGAVYKF